MIISYIKKIDLAIYFVSKVGIRQVLGWLAALRWLGDPLSFGTYGPTILVFPSVGTQCSPVSKTEGWSLHDMTTSNSWAIHQESGDPNLSGYTPRPLRDFDHVDSGEVCLVFRTQSTRKRCVSTHHVPWKMFTAHVHFRLSQRCTAHGVSWYWFSLILHVLESNHSLQPFLWVHTWAKSRIYHLYLPACQYSLLWPWRVGRSVRGASWRCPGVLFYYWYTLDSHWSCSLVVFKIWDDFITANLLCRGYCFWIGLYTWKPGWGCMPVTTYVNMLRDNRLKGPASQPCFW